MTQQAKFPMLLYCSRYRRDHGGGAEIDPRDRLNAAVPAVDCAKISCEWGAERAVPRWKFDHLVGDSSAFQAMQEDLMRTEQPPGKVSTFRSRVPEGMVKPVDDLLAGPRLAGAAGVGLGGHEAHGACGGDFAWLLAEATACDHG
jgi:hypothetical protein